MGVSANNSTKNNQTQIDAGNPFADMPHGGGVDSTLKTTNTGKTGVPSVQSIDSKQALEYFSKAGNNYQTNALQGLQVYQGEIQKALAAVQAGFQQANAQLEPWSVRGATAGDQFMKMLGLNAPSPTRHVASQVSALGPQYGDVAAQLRAAENIQDPAARTTAKNNIMARLGQLNAAQMQTLQGQSAAEIAALGPRPTMDTIKAKYPSMIADMIANPSLSYGRAKDILNYSYGQNDYERTKYGMKDGVATGPLMTEYDSKVAGIQQKYGAQLQQFQQSSAAATNGFSSNYDANANYFGYTGGGKPLTVSGAFSGGTPVNISPSYGGGGMLPMQQMYSGSPTVAYPQYSNMAPQFSGMTMAPYSGTTTSLGGATTATPSRYEPAVFAQAYSPYGGTFRRQESPDAQIAEVRKNWENIKLDPGYNDQYAASRDKAFNDYIAHIQRTGKAPMSVAAQAYNANPEAYMAMMNDGTAHDKLALLSKYGEDRISALGQAQLGSLLTSTNGKDIDKFKSALTDLGVPAAAPYVAGESSGGGSGTTSSSSAGSAGSSSQQPADPAYVAYLQQQKAKLLSTVNPNSQEYGDYSRAFDEQIAIGRPRAVVQPTSVPYQDPNATVMTAWGPIKLSDAAFLGPDGVVAKHGGGGFPSGGGGSTSRGGGAAFGGGATYATGMYGTGSGNPTGGGLEGSSPISGASPEITGTLANAIPGMATAFNRLNSESTAPITAGYLQQNVPGFEVALSRLYGLDTAPLNNYSLRNTPGYQFMYEQGNQAVLAAAAAGGLLGSGNTLTAADKYSQGLAEQIYQYESQLQQQRYTTDQQVVNSGQQFEKQIQQQKYNADQQLLQQAQNSYMNQVIQMAGIGANADNKMAENHANSGLAQGELYQSNGQAALDTYTGIGRALFDMATNQGNTLNQNSLANQSAQNMAIMAKYNKGSGGQSQIAGLANTAMQMGNQQNQARGFNLAMGGGGGNLFQGISGWSSIGPIGGSVGSIGNGKPSF